MKKRFFLRSILIHAVAVTLLLPLLLQCESGMLPKGLAPTKAGDGPTIRFDLYAKPLPEVPLPTDIAARPDPNSPTGIRLNASHYAPTNLESTVRQLLDELDGWGTYTPITVSFDCPGDRDGVCLDLDLIQAIHQQDGYDFSDDAIYLVSTQREIADPDDPRRKKPNPDYGKPVPIDIGGGNFPLYLDGVGYYYPHDPRDHSPTIFFESDNEFRGEDADCDGRLDRNEDANHNRRMDPGEDLDADGWLDIDEDTDGDGVLDRPVALDEDPARRCVKPDFYDPKFDTNYDGILGRANVWCTARDYRSGKCRCLRNRECPRNLNPESPEEMERLQLLLDPEWHTIGHYELATNTLIIRPLIPLRERSRYAVIITNRLTGEDGKPVRSPFKYINHVEQTDDLADLPTILEKGRETYFGPLELEDVSFAWSFTTQSVTADLRALRRGLYGHGLFARLADDFPPEWYANRTWACNPRALAAGRCDEATHLTEDQNRHHFIIRSEDLIKIILDYSENLVGLSPREAAPIVDGYRYVDYFVFGHFWSPNFLDSNGDGVEAYRYMNEDVDGDGNLDKAEDTDMDEVLDPGEDLDGDTRLDRDEDLNHDGKLDVVSQDEGVWKVNSKTGEGRYSKTLVPFLLAVPKKELKMKGREDKPFPVVFYGHGYTSMRIEALGFAGSLAKFGLATVAIDAVHHGLGAGEVDKTTIKGVFYERNLAGLEHGFLVDRAVDMNGDGLLESAGDFWTAYVFHTRDVVRQSALDHFALIRIFRAFDGVRLAGPVDIDGDGQKEEGWDFINWNANPASRYYELVGDYNADGQVDLAGDFNGDGEVDVGGPDNPYYAWGQSLGGIMSALMGGAEPAIRAIAPTAGGGGLADIGIRSTQGGVKEAVILRIIGPILTTTVVDEGRLHGESKCNPGDLSFAFTVPDLNEDVNVEFACACLAQRDQEEVQCPDEPVYIDHISLDLEAEPGRPIVMRPGDGVVVFNATKGEANCALVEEGGGLRISFPSDLLDRIEVAVYDGSDGVPFKSFEGCEVVPGAQMTAHITTWRRHQRFQFWEWNMIRREGDPPGYAGVGQPLVSPAEGYGKVKNTPSFRRFLALAQVGIDPADPINYAPHYFRDPLPYPEEEQHYGADRRTSAIVIGTVGDMNVPVSTAAAQGRAAGIINLFDTQTPWGKSVNQVYLDNYVIEAVERLGRSYPDDASGSCTPHAAPFGCAALFDVDDLDRGCDQKRVPGTDKPIPYLETPARWWVPSNPLDWGECIPSGTDPDTGFDKWECGNCILLTSTVTSPPEMPTRLDACRKGKFVERVSCPGGVSLMLWPYLVPQGEHGFGLPQPCQPFDLDMFMVNMIGQFFASGGTMISFEMCNQMQLRLDAKDPTGSYFMFCPFWNFFSCPACPNRLCSREWYEANRPPSCPDRWEEIPQNERELLPELYTTFCMEQ